MWLFVISRPWSIFWRYGETMSLKRAKEIIDVFEQQKKLGRFGRGEVFIIELLYELIDSVDATKAKK